MLTPGTLYKTIPMGQVGLAKIVHDSPDALTRLRAARDGQPLNGEKYTRLFVDGEPWMTDAEFECRTNRRVVDWAAGDVLIAGLGIGLILRPMLDSPDVETVTVLERSADVIALIGPQYQHPKLTIIEADVYTWTPPKKAYNLIYFDVWASVPNEDNKEEIASLKKRYRSALKRCGRSMAWCEEYARRRSRW